MKIITLNEYELRTLKTVLTGSRIDIKIEIENGNETDIMKSYLNDTEGLISKLENAKDMITTRERIEREIEVLKTRWDDVYEIMCDLKRQGKETENIIESLTRIRAQRNVLEWILREEDKEKECIKNNLT